MEFGKRIKSKDKRWRGASVGRMTTALWTVESGGCVRAIRLHYQTASADYMETHRALKLIIKGK